MASDSSPDCPKCSGGMTLRTARKGANAGGQFWGCLKYPKCNGTKDATSDDISTLPVTNGSPSSIAKLIIPTERPRPLLLASTSKERRAQFYEGTSVPRSAVKHFNLQTYTHCPTSKKTVRASSKEMPCFFSFAEAFLASHSNLILLITTL